MGKMDSEKMKHELLYWEKIHRSDGYHVERLSAGQARPYGPTNYKYIVICLEPCKEQDVREYCIATVQKADDPVRHSLLMHLIEFKRIGPRTYYYECGHDYDD
jgi:hypothetical protein